MRGDRPVLQNAIEAQTKRLPIEEIADAHTYFTDHQVRIQRVGRDMPGSNWHTYVYDPDGHTNELYYGIEQIGWNQLSKPRALYYRGFQEKPPLPQVSGTIALDEVGVGLGLSQPVRIVRDRWGVPHIYARNERDLFFAQGFVQAQDRLFQMDLWRRSTQGRLSEVLGLNFVERDAATRRVQYRGEMSAEWASYGPGVKPIAEAFVRGVNASR